MQGARGVLGYSYIATPENLQKSLLITLAGYIIGKLFTKSPDNIPRVY